MTSGIDFGKGEFFLEVSNERNSVCARIRKVTPEGTHITVAQVTIPTGQTKELLQLTTSDATRKKWRRQLIPDSIELYGLFPVFKWDFKKLKE